MDALVLIVILWSIVGGAIYIPYILKKDKQAPIWLIILCGPSVWIGASVIQYTIPFDKKETNERVVYDNTKP